MHGPRASSSTCPRRPTPDRSSSTSFGSPTRATSYFALRRMAGRQVPRFGIRLERQPHRRRTLFLVILLSAIVVVFVVVLPTRSAVRQVDRRLALIGSGYFLLIGLGFMFAEIGLIQRISVFLGHPVYALSIGLFSIILRPGSAAFCPSGWRRRAPAISSSGWVCSRPTCCCCRCGCRTFFNPRWRRHPALAGARERRRHLPRGPAHGVRLPDGHAADHRWMHD